MIENKIIIGQRYKHYKNGNVERIKDVHGNRVIASNGIYTLHDFSRQFFLIGRKRNAH